MSTPGEAPQGHDEPVLRLRDTELASRVLQDETVTLDLRSSTYLSVNPSGTVLWRQLEHGATRSQLIDALLEEFEVSHERAAADVDTFLTDCKQRDLITSD